ncbi:MAG: glycosyltransferase [Oscillospiraceae bacterium]|nr:glycosyltransferase [Oscillospiraceae bacterium]
MENAKFSVAISVYKNDSATDFDRALESITSLQTVKPAEIVLVVDGLVGEDLDTVIAKYEKLHNIFNVIRLPRNAGLGNALKVAVENAKFELIARMDGDDISVPTRFEQQLAVFAKDETIDIVGGDISEFIGEESNVVAFRKVPAKDADIKEYMKTRCPMNHVSVMFKKCAVQMAGGYQDLFWNEDYYLWIRMFLSDAVFANTGTVLVNVRTGRDMYQRRGGKLYFASEKFLQDYMLKKKMITWPVYCMNVLKRWIVQCLLPNSIRGWVFRTFARKGK